MRHNIMSEKPRTPNQQPQKSPQQPTVIIRPSRPNEEIRVPNIPTPPPPPPEKR